MMEEKERPRSGWKAAARALKVQTYALYLAARDPRVPWYAKAWIFLVVAYAFSPIDLIPDFIPVLGYVDDLILIPLGVAVALRLIDPVVMAECRAQADEAMRGPRPVFGWMAVVIVCIWVAAIALVGMWVYRLLRR